MLQLKVSLLEEIKFAIKCEENNVLAVAVDVPLHDEIKHAHEGTPEGLLKDALTDLHIDF